MNTQTRTFVVSDIHGCFLEFAELLDLMPMNLRIDRLIILGDMIDRGPQSYDVVRKVMALQDEYGQDHVIVLRGNHEQMAVDYYGTGDNLWDYNGNEATIRSFLKNQDDVQNYLVFFRKLPLIYQDESSIYVHAGIDPNRPLMEQTDEDLLCIRQTFYKSRKKFSKTVIYGHTPTPFMTGKDYPDIKSDRIGIDTGCVYGGSLSGLEIAEGKARKIYQVKKKR